MSSYIQVAEDEGEEPIELPTEDDSTLLLTTLAAQFPGTCGLKYRNPESRTMRGVRLVDGRLHPPENGWGKAVYFCVFPKGEQRQVGDFIPEREEIYTHSIHAQAHTVNSNVTKFYVLVYSFSSQLETRICLPTFGNNSSFPPFSKKQNATEFTRKGKNFYLLI